MPDKRQSRAAQTRERLLLAGQQLAAEKALAELSVDQIVTAAGVAKGTFYVHFDSRQAYWTALHADFHQRAAARVLAARTHAVEDEMLAGTWAYLDFCLEQAATKALLLEARALPEIRLAVQAQNRRFAELLRPMIQGRGLADPAALAQLWVGMVAEVAIAEAQAGALQPALRRALRAMLPGASKP